MATAPVLPYVSITEYLTGDYEPYCEYVDGILEPKSLSDKTHSRLQMLLGTFLVSQEERFGFRTYSELHIRVAPTRFRIPDLCVLASAPENARYAEETPLLTIEIVSFDEPWPKLRAKVRDHMNIGVPFVIVADPYTRTVMTTQDGLLREVPAPLLVPIEIEGREVFRIDFDDLFRRAADSFEKQ